jgi:hypothetical protein
MLWLPPIESIMDIVNYAVVNPLGIHTLKLNMKLFCVSHIDWFYLLFLAKCPGPNISYILRTKTNSTIYTQTWGSNNRTNDLKNMWKQISLLQQLQGPYLFIEIYKRSPKSFYDPPALRFITRHPSKSPVQSQRISLGYRF